MMPTTTEWLTSKGIDLNKASLLPDVQYGKDWIRYPRYGLDGEVVGHKVRDLGKGRHYNEPAGISAKDTMPWVINPQRENVIVCEGESDTLAVGLSRLAEELRAAALCAPGSSSFPAPWAKVARRYATIWVASDSDEAGDELARRVASMVPGTRRLKPPSGDMCDALLAHPTAYLKAIAQSAPVMRGDIKIERHSYDRNGPGRKHSHRLVQEVVKDGVLLKRHGAELKALCPFHEENTPSFYVNEKKGYYYCHGCGAKGDVVRYLMERRGMTFAETARYLEGR